MKQALHKCRECGITDIEPGIEIGGEILCWADDDLCSFCQDRLQAALERDAARYRYLRNQQTRPADIAGGGVFAGQVPDNAILSGEDLDRVIDAKTRLDIPQIDPLEKRLAVCLAECIDAPLFTGRNIDGCGGFTSRLELRMGFFQPEIANRAAELLEEAGQ